MFLFWLLLDPDLFDPVIVNADLDHFEMDPDPLQADYTLWCGSGTFYSSADPGFFDAWFRSFCGDADYFATNPALDSPLVVIC